jgi:hypothetical protein
MPLETHNESIQTIYEYPFIPNNNDHALPWDENRPMQSWARPLGEGEDPDEIIPLQTYVPLSPTSTDAIQIGFSMTKGDASKANILPQDHPANQWDNKNFAYFTAPPAPFPMRDLMRNESLRATPAGLVLTVTEFAPSGRGR